MEILTEVLSAEKRIRPYILHTPLEFSPSLSEWLQAEVWLKMEHIQTTGSFKLRGAANRLLSLKASQVEKGIITASTGNHGAAVAYMAHRLGIDCTIYLPENVSPTKVAFMKSYGASMEYYGMDSVESEIKAREVAKSQKKLFVSPYNDPMVVAGQGTLGFEVLRDLEDVEGIFVPVGGGGLISGVAGYLKHIRDEIKVVGCQPANSAVMYKSLKAGKVLDLPSEETWSDGTAGGLETDSMTFEMCQQYVDEWNVVSEEEIERALLYMLEHHYLLVEGAAALALSSLLQNRQKWVGKKVVLVLCGRKMSMKGLRKLLGKS
ncbi:MAG: threonine/serine dehydratase [Bacteroidota bacterium]